jgi:hypothetical protein
MSGSLSAAASRQLLDLCDRIDEINETTRQALNDVRTQIESIIRIGRVDPGDTPEATKCARTRRKKVREPVMIENLPVPLPPTLKGLYGALSLSPGVWWTARELSVELGGGKSAHAVAQGVYRLRQVLKSLASKGLKGRIESRRGFGWRWRAPDRG